MRLLGLLARLLLALAYVSAATAQARPGVSAPVAASHHHPDGATGIGHPDCGHGGPATEHPGRAHDDCRSSCCFSVARLPVPVSAAHEVAFASPVRYVIGARHMAGRATAPDPGVPRHLS